MNMTTITMDKAEARKRFLEYRQAVRERHAKEDEQIMRGYRALSRGKQVIDLVATIRAGGTQTKPSRRWSDRDDAVLPNLAIMRADQEWCRVHTRIDGSLSFHPKEARLTNETRNLVELPAGTVPAMEWGNLSNGRFRAMVPPLPPALRPADKLGNYHVLWEAEWEAAAPEDPALLKHIGGDLYAVVATWDLTELERTVLSGRLR